MFIEGLIQLRERQGKGMLKQGTKERALWCFRDENVKVFTVKNERNGLAERMRNRHVINLSGFRVSCYCLFLINQQYFSLLNWENMFVILVLISNRQARVRHI